MRATRTRLRLVGVAFVATQLVLVGTAQAVHDAGVFELEDDLAGPASPPAYV
jgi:hypothetical protein